MASKYISRILTTKLSLIFVFLLIYKLPIIDPLHFVFFILLLLFVFSIVEFKKKIEFKILILIILLASCSYFLEKKTIIEKHAIFLPNKHNQNLYLNENDQIYSLLINDFNNSYNEKDINCTNRCWKDIKLDTAFSRSFDQINFGKLNYSRKVSSINHSNITNARIGDINTVKFTWYDNPDYWWDKEKFNKIKRINAPYIIQYKFIDDKYSNSKICWHGKAIVNNQPTIIENKKIKCQNIYKNLKILFFNFNNPLEVNLKKSKTIIFINLISEFTKLLSLLTFIYFSIHRISNTKLFNYSIISLFSSIALIYTIISKKEFSFGYSPLQGGMDGLIHEGYGRAMYENFLNMNFLEVFRGGEGIYYFMPGLRYFTFLENHS